MSARRGPRIGRAVIAAVVALGALWLASSALADTITVNTSDDNPVAGGECSGVAGDCSLRQAINKSASGGTVDIPASIGRIQLVAAHTAININKDLTITGAGAGTTIVDGQDATIRLFVIAGQRTVTFSGMTLTGGVGANGAAIDTDGGTLTLDGVAVNQNTSGGANTQGNGVIDAVAASGGITVNLQNSSFSGNNVGGGGTSGVGQGVVNVSGTQANVNVANSTFTGNTVGGGGGNGFGPLDVESLGGVGTLAISGSTFSGNTIGVGGEAFGTVSILFTTSGSSATVTDSTFTGNTLGGGASGSGGNDGLASGGGIDMQSSNGGSLSVERSVFTNNRLGGNGAGGSSSGAGNGGGIEAFFSGPGSLTVDHSTFSGNTLGGSGGAGMFSGDGTGGGIEASFSTVPSTMSITSSVFGDNVLGGAGGSGDNSGDGEGGGLSLGSTSGLAATIAGNSFSSNRLGGNGGSATGAGSGTGGGILLDTFFLQSHVTIANNTFAGNAAGGTGGSGGAGDGVGAGLAIEGGTISLLNDTFAGNTIPSAGGEGAGIFGQNGATSAVTLENTIVAGNTIAGAASSCSSPLTSAGHNLESSSPSQCGLGAAGDLVGVGPLLGPLQDNGGPSPTQALLPGSPAINAGDNSGCPATDQRGVARPQGICDIGAYEVAAPAAVTGSASAIKTTSATLGGSAANPDAQGASAVFQFGKTASYGSQTAALTLGAGAGTTAVGLAATALKPNTTYHFREVVTNPDGTSLGADKTFKTASGAPKLSKLSMHPTKVVPASGRGASFTKKAKTGATVSYRDSKKATTTFSVQVPKRGFRSGKRCVAKRPKGHKKAKRCTFYKSVGSFTHKDKSGANRFHFTGRVKRKPLPHGHYRLQAVARSGKTKSRAVTVKFRVV
jgi:hypothetical protein